MEHRKSAANGEGSRPAVHAFLKEADRTQLKEKRVTVIRKFHFQLFSSNHFSSYQGLNSFKTLFKSNAEMKKFWRSSVTSYNKCFICVLLSLESPVLYDPRPDNVCGDAKSFFRSDRDSASPNLTASALKWEVVGELSDSRGDRS